MVLGLTQGINLLISGSIAFALRAAWIFAGDPRYFNMRNRYCRQLIGFVEFIGTLCIGSAITRLAIEWMPRIWLLDENGQSDRWSDCAIGGFFFSVFILIMMEKIHSRISAMEKNTADLTEVLETKTEELKLTKKTIRDEPFNLGQYSSGDLHQRCSECGWWQTGHSLELTACLCCGADMMASIGLEFGGLFVEFEGERVYFSGTVSGRIHRPDIPDVIEFLRRHARDTRNAKDRRSFRFASGQGNYSLANARWPDARIRKL